GLRPGKPRAGGERVLHALAAGSRLHIAFFPQRSPAYWIVSVLANLQYEPGPWWSFSSFRIASFAACSRPFFRSNTTSPSGIICHKGIASAAAFGGAFSSVVSATVAASAVSALQRYFCTAS